MDKGKIKEKVFSIIKFALGWPISIIALFFLSKTFLSQTADVNKYIHALDLRLLVPGVICFVVYYFLRSFTWYKLLEFANHTLDLRESLFVWSFTQLRRYIPGNIWAALGLASQYGRKNISKTQVGTYILWENELVVISTVILSFLSLPLLFSIYLKRPELLSLSQSLLLIGIATGVVVYCFNRKIIHLFGGKVRFFLLHLFPSYSSIDSFKAILLTSLSFVFLSFGYFFTISSITYLDPNIIWKFVGFFSISLLIGFVSIITPSGLGVREGMLTIFLGNFMALPLAAFASIFCRLVQILCEIAFIGIAFLFHKSRSAKVNKYIQFVNDRPYELILGVFYVIFSWYFIAVSFLRFDNFYTGRFDLGNMDQTVWNTLHGRIFEFTNPNGLESISRLAFHADVILIAFAPFYLFWNSPKTLLLLQVLIVGAGAFFIFAISNYFLKKRWLSLVIAALFLLNPSLQRSVIYDFHAVTLATTFLLGAMYFIFKKKYIWFIVFAILAGSCKEQIWAVTGLMGLYIAILHKKWTLGVSVFIFSLLTAIFLIWVAIPHAAGGKEHFALEYYGESSGSPTDLIKQILLSPGQTVYTLTNEDRLSYLIKLFGPVGFLPLLAPVFIVFALPDLLINTLSRKPELYQIYYQYTAAITPFLYIGMIVGIVHFRKYFRSVPFIVIVSYIVFMGLYGAYRYGPLPGSKEPNTDMFTRPYMGKERLDRFLKSIPEDLSVSTTNSIGSHLAHRQRLYNVPFAMDSADVVIIDDSDHNLPDPTSMYATKAAQLESDSNYQIVYDDKTVKAFKKITTPKL